MKLEPLHEENLKRLRKLLTRSPREDPHLLGIMRIAVAFRATGGLDKAQLGPLRGRRSQEDAFIEGIKC
jgi:hypothetical protein